MVDLAYIIMMISSSSQQQLCGRLLDQKIKASVLCNIYTLQDRCSTCKLILRNEILSWQEGSKGKAKLLVGITKKIVIRLKDVHTTSQSSDFEQKKAGNKNTEYRIIVNTNKVSKGSRSALFRHTQQIQYIYNIMSAYGGGSSYGQGGGGGYHGGGGGGR